MYIAITGSKNNKDVYIYRSFRKENGKSSSCIYKKLGKYNALLEQFDGDEDKLMAWTKKQTAKETGLYYPAAIRSLMIILFFRLCTYHIPCFIINFFIIDNVLQICLVL